MKSRQVEWAIEIKNTLSPKISKGLLISMEDTKAAKWAVISRVNLPFIFQNTYIATIEVNTKENFREFVGHFE